MVNNIKHIYHVHPSLVAEFINMSTYHTICKAIQKYLNDNGKILDVGCGRGELMRLLTSKGYNVFGCDMDPVCVSSSNRYGEVKMLKVEEITEHYKENEFDCVVISHVLEHIENPKDVIEQLVSISKKYIIISVPNPLYLPYVVKSVFQMSIGYINTGHLYSWDWYHFKTFIEIGCGQKVLEWYYDTVSLPLPTKFREVLLKMKLLKPIENGILKYLFPRFCRSITAVIEKRN